MTGVQTCALPISCAVKRAGFVGYANDYDPASGQQINNGSWHHLVYVYNTTDVLIYVNTINEKNFTVALNTGTVEGLTIGKRSYDAGSSNMTVDELCIFNRSITYDEIKFNYNSSSGVENCELTATPILNSAPTIDRKSVE